MTTRTYRLTVVASALTWLLIGLHIPGLHEMMDHGRAPQSKVLIAVAILAAAAVAGLWALLRHPDRPSTT
jgi:hypothetical protein